MKRIRPRLGVCKERGGRGLWITERSARGGAECPQEEEHPRRGDRRIWMTRRSLEVAERPRGGEGRGLGRRCRGRMRE